jgi:hypothetical protein
MQTLGLSIWLRSAIARRNRAAQPRLRDRTASHSSAQAGTAEPGFAVAQEVAAQAPVELA